MYLAFFRQQCLLTILKLVFSFSILYIENAYKQHNLINII